MEIEIKRVFDDDIGYVEGYKGIMYQNFMALKRKRSEEKKLKFLKKQKKTLLKNLRKRSKPC